MKIAKRFMDWYQGNNEKETAPPRSGVGRICYVILNYSGRLILVQLLFWLCCLPLVTIPASVAALNRYINKIFRTGYGFTLQDYTTEWKDGLFKRLPFGLLLGAIGFYAYYLLSLAGNFEGLWAVLLTGAGAILAAFSMLAGCYYFFLASMFALPERALLKNTLLLLVIEWKADILLLAGAFLYAHFLLLLLPYSIPLVVLFGMTIWQLFVCAVLNPIAEKRILEPYERQKADCCRRQSMIQ